MFVWALPQVGRTFEARGWDVVPGVITAQHRTTEGLWVEIGKHSNSSHTEARLHVEFTFNYDGQQFTGDRISPLRPWVMDSREGREALEVGRSISVHVNPYDPTDSVIDVSVPWGAVAWLAAASAGLVWAFRVFVLPPFAAQLRAATKRRVA